MSLIACMHVIFQLNVTGQRTRHLVAGTLDPIVGEIRLVLRSG